MKKICVSEFILDFIKEYVFKPLCATFYIDKKIMLAIEDIARCYELEKNLIAYYKDYRCDKLAEKRSGLFREFIETIKSNGNEIDYIDLNQRLNVQKQESECFIDKNYLKLLAMIIEKIDPEYDEFYYANMNKYLTELTKDLNATIEYLDTCSEKELNYSSGVFEELSEYFKSQKLIECVERNIMRFDNKEMQERLKTELEYMKEYM